MIDGIITGPDFWRALPVFLFLYYAIVLTVLYGPKLLARRKNGIGKINSPVEDSAYTEQELCQAFQEYARVYQKIETPRFEDGKLLVPSNIQLDLLSKQPFCQVVEREKSTPKPS
ncbi:hypothetical protein [Echinicola shivajiensis]|uniref:hypothetical protein n=1 Tax=Echinicola shivajiensis TaxID=1035916 RepID=UPI001BFC0531|nr:hypothetical protein [Echinicola shivajiensis]